VVKSTVCGGSCVVSVVFSDVTLSLLPEVLTLWLPVVPDSLYYQAMELGAIPVMLRPASPDKNFLNGNSYRKD
jgi:hypothetical protein